MLVPLILAIAIVAALCCFLNFRFLLYPIVPRSNPVGRARHVELKGATLFVSDFHLKSKHHFSSAGQLRNFIETRHVANLVLLGDVFDSPDDFAKIVGTDVQFSRLLKWIGLEGLPLNAFWIVGSPAHDPKALQSNGDESVRAIGECAMIHLENARILVYHGHDMSRIGAVGHAFDRFVKPLALELFWRRFAGVERHTWAFFGHTHIPGVDSKNLIANCGGWKPVPLLVKPTRTGILVQSGSSMPLLAQIAAD